ncbi:MAG: hypothetical protein HY754_07995 [Nitrospirae bacterium]|nr:hypothetical protein [Nitrospirota bacterium]
MRTKMYEWIARVIIISLLLVIGSASAATQTGTYYYWVGAYDTSYNLLDSDSFAFTVTSSTSKSGENHDWGTSGWDNN